MRKLLFIFGLLLCALPARAANAVFVAQVAAGANDGSSCANAKAITYFNTVGNWSATPTGIQIGPDTTVHLCGTITTAPVAQGSGTSGHNVIIFFETGAKISLAVCPASGCLQLDGQSFITVDGGVACGWTYVAGVPTSQASLCNGIIEATANGTGLANQTASTVGISLNNVTNIEAKNLMIRNIYVRNSNSDVVLSSSGPPSCVYANGTANTVKIHDSVMHDTLWCLEFVSGSVQQNIEFYKTETYNVGHSRAYGVVSQTDTNIWDHDNWDHDHTNWDSSGCKYHNDGIHAYQTAGGVITNLYEYNNVYSGNWGNCPTAMIYTEGVAFTLWAFNNVGNGLSTGVIGNGCFTLTVGTSGSSHAYNNTCIMSASQNNYLIKWEGASDIQNNANANTTATLTTMPTDVTVPGGSLIDYNAWGMTPTFCTLFASGSASTACNGAAGYLNFTQWKSFLISTFPSSGGDSHGLASSTTNLGVSSTTMIPQLGSPLVGVGANLNSLCNGQPVPGIGALCSDAAGVARPAAGAGAWDIGAYQSGTSPTGGGVAPAVNIITFDAVPAPATTTVTQPSITGVSPKQTYVTSKGCSQDMKTFSTTCAFRIFCSGCSQALATTLSLDGVAVTPTYLSNEMDASIAASSLPVPLTITKHTFSAANPQPTAAVLQ